jgi:DNA-binding FadR family transcriptional regulator
MESSSHPMRLSLDHMMKAGQAEGSRYLTEVREMMEPEIATLAAERADAEDLAAMRESFEVVEGAKRDPDTFRCGGAPRCAGAGEAMRAHMRQVRDDSRRARGA